ncbi:MAG TPA: protein-disulfide reductase DsbD domain-containing protein [Vicinamibacterales bacterium]|jgi:DsbC/DsbD-like thiol-disulfide interchange protein|nr:protein-disulfide reductase DsbD domain-containing protein [Vicinamibacterales bacterium]
MCTALLCAALLLQMSGAPLSPSGKNAPKHLTLATSTSAPVVTPGSNVSFFVDVTPNAGIHVYAPGADDYLPIALKLAPSAGVVAGKVAYPKSETMLVGSDRVPVFQKPFRLTQELTVAVAAKSGTTITVNGTVNYQACDDVVCFIPASAPVSWTVRVK